MSDKSLIPLSFSSPFLEDRMGDLFDLFFSDIQAAPLARSRFPFLNVVEKDNEVVVKAELPGMKESDVKIEAVKNKIMISGERKDEIEDKEGAYRICESSYGKFSRSMTLPFEIDASHTQASFADGVLTLTIPKPEIERIETKKISIGKQKEKKQLKGE